MLFQILKTSAQRHGSRLFSTPGNKITHHTIVDLAHVPCKNELTDKLFKIYQRTEYGRDYKTFCSRFHDDRPKEITIHVMQNPLGEWVGYSIIRRFMMTYPSHTVNNQNTFALFTTSVAILPEYRGQRAMTMGSIWAMNKMHRNSPDVNIIGLNTLHHPLAYLSLLKYAPRTYPHPTENTPKAISDFITYLKKDYNHPSISKSNPWLTRDGNHIFLSDDERMKFHQQHNEPGIGFFARNTQLKAGQALLCFNIYYLVSGNPLQLDATKKWPFANNEADFDSTSLARGPTLGASL